jgi:hypothetical protein
MQQQKYKRIAAARAKSAIFFLRIALIGGGCRCDIDANLDADFDRVASSKVGDMISITVDSDMEAKRLTVDPAQSVHETIAAAFGCQSQQQVQRVLFGDTDVLEGESFEDHGVEVGGVAHSHRELQVPSVRLSCSLTALVFGHRQDGARLSASVKTRKASVREVAVEIVARNPSAAADGLTVEILMEGVEVDPEDTSHVLGDLDWSSLEIVVLPESIGDLTVGGCLYLYSNKLESLPKSFGGLTVGGYLAMYNNPVAESLNEHSFPGLTLILHRRW